MPDQYDNRGDVALWKPKSDNPKAPAAKGTVIAHRDIREGEALDIALWRNQSDNPNAPLMKGRISDKQAPSDNAQPPRSPSDAGQEPDDPIPF